MGYKRKSTRVLKQITAWYADDEHWVQHVSACSPSGVYEYPKSPSVAKTCLIGAIHRFSPNQLVWDVVYDRIGACIGNEYGTVVAFNDNPSTTVEDVRRVVRCALQQKAKKVRH